MGERQTVHHHLTKKGREQLQEWGDEQRRLHGYQRPGTRDDLTRCGICGERLLGDPCQSCRAPGGREHVGRGEGELVVKLFSLRNGGRSGFEGQYLKDYDPTEPHLDAHGRPMLCRIEATDSLEEALHFADMAAAWREWKRWDGWVRPDGKPSRPLTAFNIELARHR